MRSLAVPPVLTALPYRKVNPGLRTPPPCMNATIADPRPSDRVAWSRVSAIRFPTGILQAGSIGVVGKSAATALMTLG